MLSESIECCSMEDSIADVLARMARVRVRRLPVTGGNGELLGIISIADVLRQGDKKIAKRAAKTLLKISRPSEHAESCRN
jgi:CBS domain-containing protein